MLSQVAEELRGLGYTPEIVQFPSFPSSSQAVLIDIDVEHGRYKAQTLTIGISFQEDSYPEYPPHFVHFKSSISTDIATKHSVHEFKNEKWSAYSLPPSDFWDRLDSSQKNMKTYIRRHLFRVLANL